MTAGSSRSVRVVSRRRRIGRHLTSAYAYDRVAAALYEVIVDSVELGACHSPASQAREWLRAAVARPLRLSSVVALETLRREIDRAFDAAPATFNDWLNERRD